MLIPQSIRSSKVKLWALCLSGGNKIPQSTQSSQRIIKKEVGSVPSWEKIKTHKEHRKLTKDK
jgi:hypothetical protein